MVTRLQSSEARTQSLLLNSLEVKNFRTFRNLHVERLGRVNLIVGANNTGKTTVLEALRLFSGQGNPMLIWDILNERDELDGHFPYSSAPFSQDPNEIEEQIFALRYLFHGRQSLREPLQPIEVGPISSERLFVSLAWLSEEDYKQGRSTRAQPPLIEEYADDIIPTLVIGIGDQQEMFRLDLEFRFLRRSWSRIETNEIPYVFVPANGLRTREIGYLWDDIALTDLEEEVLEALRIIAPDVQRINLIGSQESRKTRIPKVRLHGVSDPIPLASMGGGMNRLFGISLALVNAQNGLLLVDEVENGLHYSVQPEVWKLIFEIAGRLNSQVFATTHSWDCVEAFQQTASEMQNEQGILISLRRSERNPDEIAAVLFDEEDLEIVTRSEIEVR